MRKLWPTEFGWGEPNEPGPQTEDSRERGFVPDDRLTGELGQSESIETEDGDIADEGPGRRG